MKKKIFNESAVNAWNEMTNVEQNRVVGGDGFPTDPDGEVEYLPDILPDQEDEDDEGGWINVSWIKRF